MDVAECALRIAALEVSIENRLRPDHREALRRIIKEYQQLEVMRTDLEIEGARHAMAEVVALHEEALEDDRVDTPADPPPARRHPILREVDRWLGREVA